MFGFLRVLCGRSWRSLRLKALDREVRSGAAKFAKNASFLLATVSLVYGAEIRGKITDVIGGEPLARVEVSVIETGAQATTANDGTFVIRDLRPGNYTLRFTAVGYRLITVPLSISIASDTRQFDVNLAPDNFRRTDKVEVHGDVFQADDSATINEMNLTSTEIKQASTVIADDPFRAIQSLPGVSASGNNELFAQFSVMGAPFEQVGIYLDDVLIPAPFHDVPSIQNGASMSLLTSETVQELKLLPVAYPEKVGDETGAALEIVTREGSRTRPQFRAAPGIADSEFLGEGGLSEKGSWLASVRKSYIGWLVRNRVGPDFSDISFYDGDLKLNYDPTPAQSLTLYGMAGHTNVETAHPISATDLKQGASDFYFGRLGWRWSINPHLLLDNRMAYIGDPYSETDLDGGRIHNSYREWSGGSNIAWSWTKDNLLEGGWTLRRFAAAAGYYHSLGNGYLQQSSSLLDQRLHLSGGIRIEETPHSAIQPFSPQAAASFDVAKSTQLQFGYGRYVALSPDFTSYVPQLNCTFSQQTWDASDHLTAGIEQRFGGNARVRVQVFHRHDHFSLRETAPCGTASAPPSGSDYERTYSRGAQLILQRRSSNRLSGWIGYTFVSARQSRALFIPPQTRFFTPYYAAPEDQRHSLNSFATYRLKPTINLSGKFLFGSGFPLTGGFFPNARGGVSRLPEVRLDPYLRVDARVDKSWAFTRWKLTLYGEVLNVTNHPNRIVTYAVFNDNGQLMTATAEALPITPTTGLAFEF